MRDCASSPVIRGSSKAGAGVPMGKPIPSRTLAGALWPWGGARNRDGCGAALPWRERLFGGRCFCLIFVGRLFFDWRFRLAAAADAIATPTRKNTNAAAPAPTSANLPASSPSGAVPVIEARPESSRLSRCQPSRQYTQQSIPRQGLPSDRRRMQLSETVAIRFAPTNHRVSHGEQECNQQAQEPRARRTMPEPRGANAIATDTSTSGRQDHDGADKERRHAESRTARRQPRGSASLVEPASRKTAAVKPRYQKQELHDSAGGIPSRLFYSSPMAAKRTSPIVPGNYICTAIRARRNRRFRSSSVRRVAQSRGDKAFVAIVIDSLDAENNIVDAEARQRVFRHLAHIDLLLPPGSRARPKDDGVAGKVGGRRILPAQYSVVTGFARVTLGVLRPLLAPLRISRTVSGAGGAMQGWRARRRSRGDRRGVVW